MSPRRAIVVLMKYRFCLSPQAEEDLLEISEYISRDNKSAAGRMVDRFTETF